MTEQSECHRLGDVIRERYGFDSRYLRSEQVRLDGASTDSAVHVFAISGHPATGLAYAWSAQSATAGDRDVVVLGVPPISRPEDAVKAWAARGGGRH